MQIWIIIEVVHVTLFTDLRKGKMNFLFFEKKFISTPVLNKEIDILEFIN